MFGLDPADAIVLAGYLAGVTALGVWTARRFKNLAEFFLPRKFNKAFMIMYAFGTGTASDQAVLVAAATFKNGVSGIWYQWLWLFATPFYWMIAPLMRRFRAITTADVYALRFSPSVARLFAVVGVLSLSVKIGVMLKGAGVLLEAATAGAMNSNLTILLMSVIFVVYGSAGGLSAVVMTDFVQGLLTLLFSFMLLPLVMHEVGGMEGVRATIADPSKLSLVTPGKIGVFFIVMFGLQALVGIVAQPFVMATCSAGKTEMDGRIGFVAGNFIKRLCTIAWTLTALGATALYIQRGIGTAALNPDHVYGDLARMLLPPRAPGLLGLFIASLLASVTASCGSFMISSSALITSNLYKPLVIGRDPAHYLKVARIAAVLVVAGGVAFAWYVPSLIKGLETWLSIAPMMGIAFWMGLFWRRMTPAGAWASTLAAFATWWLVARTAVLKVLADLPFARPLGLLWYETGKSPEIYEPWRIALYMTAGGVSGVVVSLLTKRVDAERLDRFFGLVLTPEQPGEKVEQPCTLPAGAVVPKRPMVFSAFEFRVPWPSKTSLVGFFVSWLLVGVLVGGFVWYVGG
jgi:Na+/proline symporter